LVVGLRLGCINHAALTLEAISRASKHCVGWVGVVIDPVMQGLQANIDFLKSNLDVPLLGIFPNLSYQDFELLALQIDLKMLKKLI
jgi:dethiobiotin synthetase